MLFYWLCISLNFIWQSGMISFQVYDFFGVQLIHDWNEQNCRNKIPGVDWQLILGWLFGNNWIVISDNQREQILRVVDGLRMALHAEHFSRWIEHSCHADSKKE